MEQTLIRKLIEQKYYDTLSNGLRVINRTIDSPYYYKDQVGTVSLQGGFQVYYAESDSSYFLYLKKADTLALLNETTNSTSLHHLGNVTEDAKKYFILGHDNGNGSPYSYEFIDKQGRKNPLGYGVEFLDYKSLNETPYLLYSDTMINGRTQLVLFNTDNKRKEFYELKNNLWELYIDTLTDKYLTIKFSLNR
ncbi:MAG: hypothetical protein EOP00_10750, partial [Pedobacter sp.]